MAQRFSDVLAYDMSRAVTVEDTFKYHAALASLHDWDFVTDVDGFTDGEWYESGSWTFTDGVVDGTSGVILYEGSGYDELPKDIAIEFEKLSAIGGVTFRGDDVSNYFYFRYTATEVAFGRVVAGVMTDFCTLPKVLASTGTIRVVVRDVSFSEDTRDWYRFFSVWLNDALVLTWSFNFDWETEAGVRFGFLGDSSTASYSGVRVSQLTEPVEWEIVDVGMPVMSSIERVIAGRNIRWFVRDTGELKAWRPAATTAVVDIPRERMSQRQRSRDWRKLATHIRTVGGWYESDVFDGSLYNAYGHRFEIDTNPVIETLSETHGAAQRNLRLSKENFETLSFVIPGNPFLEAYDHITADDGSDWIILAVDHEIHSGHFMTNISCCRYISAS